ncbi:hypothetical protein MESS4_430131 [Mesorhizobium sp. STM 4661]|nr:hypothetical protein MESS4_430131 [Mesorhizobium sp. STM 4661]
MPDWVDCSRAGPRDGRFSVRKKLCRHNMCIGRFAGNVCLHEQLVNGTIFTGFGRCAAANIIVDAAFER